jgi:lipopolysaccharide export system protein LptA
MRRNSIFSRERRAGGWATSALVAALLCLSSPALAQQPGGFRTDPDKPIEVEADALEVENTKQTATFIGNVRVKQGEMRLKSDKLTVFYNGSGGAGSSRIDRIAASGNVVVSAPDAQTASGEWATYQVTDRQIEMGNAVVLRQGDNVIRGSRLYVNLATGQARVSGAEGANNGGTGRVRGLFQPDKD